MTDDSTELAASAVLLVLALCFLWAAERAGGPSWLLEASCAVYIATRVP